MFQPLLMAVSAFLIRGSFVRLFGYFLLPILLQWASSLYTKFSLALASTFDGREEGSGKR